MTTFASSNHHSSSGGGASSTTFSSWSHHSGPSSSSSRAYASSHSVSTPSAGSGSGSGSAYGLANAIGKEKGYSVGAGSGGGHYHHQHPAHGPPPPGHGKGEGVNKEILRGLRDVVWSDDEEIQECPLCMEELDPSDVNFKPCVCGYQICRFCHHQIIHDLNGKCPACRRKYDEQEVQFKPVDPEEMKRLQQAKLHKQKVNKQLEQLGRRHLRDVRIVVKNMVYVLGMKMHGNQDEYLQLLRSNDYFGQYGKIAKIFIRKSSSKDSGHSDDEDEDDESDEQDVGIYISFLRREDAARAISALDGYPAPGNSGKTLKASYGTTKYCLNWLRGVKCDEGSTCMGLHEWAAESDTFTRSDMTALQHIIKDTGTSMDMQLQRQQEQQRAASGDLGSSQSSNATPRASTPVTSRTSTDPGVDSSALPRTAHWGARPAPPSPAPAAQPVKRKAKVLSLSNLGGKPVLTTLSPSGSTPQKEKKEDVAPAVPAKASKTSSQPPTVKTDSLASGAASVADSERDQTAVAKNKTPEKPVGGAQSASSRSNSLSSSHAAPPGLTSTDTSSRNPSTFASPISTHSVPANVPKDETAEVAEVIERGSSTGSEDDEATPSMPALDPSSPDNNISGSPLPSPLPASPHQLHSEAAGTYQPSVQAQALMDDVVNRREGISVPFRIQEPYPDFEDVTLSFAEGDFTYQLDAKMELMDGDSHWKMLSSMLGSVEDLLDVKRPSGDYDGRFDPFVETLRIQQQQLTSSRDGLLDESKRRSSRFGFANRTASEITEKLTGISMNSAGKPQTPQATSAEPSYFTNVPGAVNNQSSSSDTNSGRIASAQPAQSAPSPLNQFARDANAVSNLSSSSSFPMYQMQQEQQQMLSNMHPFHQHFQNDLNQRPSSPNVPLSRSMQQQHGRFDQGFPSNDMFPYQDPAIMSMRMAGVSNPVFGNGISQQQQSSPVNSQHINYNNGGASSYGHPGMFQHSVSMSGRANSPAQQMSAGRSSSRQGFFSGKAY